MAGLQHGKEISHFKSGMLRKGLISSEWEIHVEFDTQTLYLCLPICPLGIWFYLKLKASLQERTS